VEANAVWRCGEGIQVVSDAVVRNNLIANSDIGITTAPHVQVPEMKDVTIVNNTIYGHRECLRARWDNATNMVLASNALYCPGGTAVDAAGLRGSGKVVAANLTEGAVTGAPRDGSQFSAGGTAATAFLQAEALDLWPRPASMLIGAGSTGLSADRDFNGTLRRVPYDVGAYQTNGRGMNPGWRVRQEFKRTPRTNH
jgi:hypothetical protein